MPYKSQAQERWAHTASGKAALGESGVKEWDSASKGLKLPKKVTEHPKHFELHLADGGMVKVAKKGLGPKVLHRLTGMSMVAPVKMAEGGVAPEAAEGDPTALNPNMDLSQLPIADQIALGSTLAKQSNERNFPSAPERQVTGYSIDPMTGEQVPEYAPPAAVSAGAKPTSNPAQSMWDSLTPPQTPTAPVAPGIGGGGGVSANVNRELNESSDKIMSGQREAADVQARLGQQEAQAMQAHQDAMLAKQAIHDEQAKKIQSEIEQTESEIKSGKIDPNRWFADKSTGGKMSAILGMVLGGFGAGLSHGPNMAMDLMNKQIDRDLAAQKENLNSKNNLVSLYYKKLGNLDEATLRAKADMQAALQVKIAQMGALAKGDTAQANLKMLEGQLQKERVMDGDRLATSASARYVQSIHAQTMLAEARAKGAPTISDRVTFQTSAIAAAEKQLDHMEKGDAVSSGVLSGIKGLAPGNRTASNWEAGRNLAVNELAKISKQGVPDKDEVERFLATVPKASASTAEKKAWIAEQRKYLRGQKQALNQQFAQQGKVLYPEAGDDDVVEEKAIRR